MKKHVRGTTSMTRVHELPPVEADARIFVTVAEAGSFTAAASLHAMTPSAVSKAITRLEKTIGARLISRTTRALHLTEEGMGFHARCARAFGMLAEAVEEASNGAHALVGTIRLGLPPLFGTFVVPDIVASFLAQNPRLRVELVSTMRPSDLVDRGLDAVIVVGALEDSSFAVQPLGRGQFVTVASPAYLAKAGTPRELEELESHACITYTRPDGRAAPWTFRERELAVEGLVQSDEMHHLAAMAVSGLGVTHLPLFVVARDLAEKRLARLLREHEAEPKPASLVYLAGREMPRRVRALIDHVLHHSAEIAGVSPAKKARRT
jgi:DNA-binding transcriptional LysR family regulator